MFLLGVFCGVSLMSIVFGIVNNKVWTDEEMQETINHYEAERLELRAKINRLEDNLHDKM